MGSFVPPATAESNGRRARSSTATIPPPSLRTGHQRIPASAPRQTSSSRLPASAPNGTITFNYLEKVGTFDPNDPIEIRDNATAAIALGADGFNVPSLLSINYSAPYLHRGQAQTLGGGLPAARVGASRGDLPTDDDDREHADRGAAIGSAGVPEIDRRHDAALPLRGRRL